MCMDPTFHRKFKCTGPRPHVTKVAKMIEIIIRAVIIV